MTDGLFTSWTMKLSQGSVKFVVGCWTRTGNTLVYTKEEMSDWPWSSRSPKYICECLHYLLTWSNGFCGERGKRGIVVENKSGPTIPKCCYVKFVMNFPFGEKKMKTREENRMVKVDILFKTTLFGHILKKIQHNHFFFGCMGHSSWSIFGLHLVWGRGGG